MTLGLVSFLLAPVLTFAVSDDSTCHQPSVTLGSVVQADLNVEGQRSFAWSEMSAGRIKEVDPAVIPTGKLGPR